MAKNHEGKDEGVVTMCISNGLFVIGKLIGGNKLVDPRVFDVYSEPHMESGRPVMGPDGQPVMQEKIRMRPFPANPPYCTIGPDAIKYPVTTRQGNVLALYERVTNPEPEMEKNIVVPMVGLKPVLN